MNNTNYPFNSALSNSNPFSLNQNLDDSLASSYARLEALKKQYSDMNNANKSTVFTDIDSELTNLSDDERSFILNSDEYKAVSEKYQTEFSQFLIRKFSNEYLESSGGRTPEEMLSVIRKEKEKYKSKFAADINEIRDQNKTLMNQNNKLASDNESLQKELEAIKIKLEKGKKNE